MSVFEDGSYSCLPSNALIAKVLAKKCKMEYTRAAVGKGYIPEGESPKTMLEPADYVMDANISAVTNPIDGECQVTVQINSSDVESGFFATGILLYAYDPDKGEVPYTYLTLENEPEWIRPSSSIVGKLATFDIIAAVGEVDTVTAIINSDSIVTKKVVESMIAEATIRRDITIPVTGWLDNVEGEEGGVTIDIEQEDVTEKMVPIVSIFFSDIETANDCGMSSMVETKNGYVKFYADEIPKKEINASLLLLNAYEGKISDDTTDNNSGIDINEFYKNYVATSEDMKAIIKELKED